MFQSLSKHGERPSEGAWRRGLAWLARAQVGWVVVLAVFWIGILRNVELPGLYMDAINPDYLAARWLNPGLENPVWLIPGEPLPLLGNLYHGLQTFYVGLATYGVLGMSVTSARISQALFGAAIVLLSWLLLRRAGGRPLAALALAVALGADMAFLGSFRTQSYIILAGQAWMMLGLYMAVRAVLEAHVPRRLWVLSGLGMGLAVYGYFVFLFFLPPVALLAVLGPGLRGARARALLWGGGFVLGMLPYVVGYLELIVALGGIGPFVEWMRSMLGGLKPLGGSASYGDGLASAWLNTRLGLAGIGNEMMMLNQPVSSALVGWRAGLVAVAALVCVVGGWREWSVRPRLARVLLAVASLPVVYVLLAACFGARLWVHHFTVLVAVGYLLSGLAACWLLSRLPNRRWPSLAGGVLALALLVVNVVQQERVQARLVATGGVGMSSDALTALARAARTEGTHAVWFFPDWGFFMPFAFLTGNRVPYELELTPQAVQRNAAAGRDVRVAFWKEEDQRRHRELLERSGIEDVRLYRMDRRDGAPALYVLAGRTTKTVVGAAAR